MAKDITDVLFSWTKEICRAKGKMEGNTVESAKEVVYVI